MSAVMMQREVPTILTVQTQRHVRVTQTVQRTAEAPQAQRQRSWISLYLRWWRTRLLVKVIPREPVSERTLEQIVHVPGETPRARVQQRTVELEHQSQPGAPRSLMS